MGLLDGLFTSGTYGGQGGGLLDLIRQTQQQNTQYQPGLGFADQPSPLDNAQWPQGPVGAPSNAASLPPNAQPTQGQLPEQSSLPTFLSGAPSGAGFGDRLMAGVQNFANAGGPLQALAGGLSGLVSGTRTDPAGMMQQNLKAQFDALVPTLGPQKAMLAVMNPEAGKVLISQALDKKQYSFVTLPDGTVVRQDPLKGTVEPAYASSKPYNFTTLPDGTVVRQDPVRGTVEPAYAAGTKPTFGIVGEASDGSKVYGFIDAGKNTVNPYQAPGSEERGTITGPDGKQIPIPAGADAKTFRNEVSRANAKAAAGEKTEVQAKSEKFGNKMELAERNISKVEDQLTDYKGRALDSAPIVGGTMATNWLQSDKYQQAKQARDNFITALLRDESGAAIGTSEFKRYEKELFPQPGDSQAVILQKREARKIAIEAMKKSAGPGYKSPDFGSTAEAGAPADPLGIRK